MRMYNRVLTQYPSVVLVRRALQPRVDEGPHRVTPRICRQVSARVVVAVVVIVVVVGTVIIAAVVGRRSSGGCRRAAIDPKRALDHAVGRRHFHVGWGLWRRVRANLGKPRGRRRGGT